MMAANVLDKSQLPDFDEETGLLHKVSNIIHDFTYLIIIIKEQKYAFDIDKVQLNAILLYRDIYLGVKLMS